MLARFGYNGCKAGEVHVASGTALRSASVAAYLCALSGISIAQPTNKVGWVLNDQPDATDTYTPDPTHSFNSVKGAITIALNSGHYQVYFDDLYDGAPANAQASAADGTSAYCAVDGFGREGGDGDP